MSPNRDASRVQSHFDGIADSYGDEIPPQVRRHLIEKWWSIVSPHFREGVRVIDLGCGDGANVAYLRERGIECVGVDFSPQLVHRGVKRHPSFTGRAAVADVLAVPVPDGTFDVAVIIGVLHHIYSREDQVQAVQEGMRVLKPGGVLIIRESNLFNPLFRFYWNYVFPLTAPIDRFGGENWISPRLMRKWFGEAVEGVSYFTFIPASTPRALLPALGRLERVLERSPARRFAAHYVAVLRKRAEPGTGS